MLFGGLLVSAPSRNFSISSMHCFFIGMECVTKDPSGAVSILRHHQRETDRIARIRTSNISSFLPIGNPTGPMASTDSMATERKAYSIYAEKDKTVSVLDKRW